MLNRIHAVVLVSYIVLLTFMSLNCPLFSIACAAVLSTSKQSFLSTSFINLPSHAHCSQPAPSSRWTYGPRCWSWPPPFSSVMLQDGRRERTSGAIAMARWNRVCTTIIAALFLSAIRLVRLLRMVSLLDKKLKWSSHRVFGAPGIQAYSSLAICAYNHKQLSLS